MLFIDEPTQVGFSYSDPVPGYTDPNSDYVITLPNNTCPDYASDWKCGTYSYPNLTFTANSTPAAAPNMWKTIQGFMGAFPNYTRDGFYFATESYGGHYAPIFNDYFLSQNAKSIAGAHKVNLKAVLIGNGWYDPLVGYEGYYNYSVSPGNTYDLHFNESVRSQYYTNMYGPGNCYDQTVDCNTNGLDMTCATADDFCLNSVEYLFDTYTSRDEYDIRYLSPDPFPPEYYVDYLNTPKVQKAIGAFVNYTESSNAVSKSFGSTGDDDREIGVMDAMKSILDHNVTLIHYYGDADYVCNWLAGEVIADMLDAPGYSEAGFVNISSSDGKVHGQVRQAGRFAFARIYESGHEVPFYQPVVALELFERVVKGMDIQTGKTRLTPSYQTSGAKASTFREGNATVQTEVLGVDEPVVYNTLTALPMYENGTSANTGFIAKKPPAEKSRAKRSTELSAEELRKREKRRFQRKKRLNRERRHGQRGVSKKGRRSVGMMRRDEMFGL